VLLLGKGDKRPQLRCCCLFELNSTTISEAVGKTSIARLLRNPKAKMERDLSTDGVEVIEIEKRCCRCD
jgi:hypothetical protein